MRLQKISIVGCLNVPDMTLELNGCNVLLYGDNMVGKSNLIRLVHALLSAKFPDGFIRHGMEKAEIEATLAEFTHSDDNPNTWTPVDGTEHRMRAVVRMNKKGAQTVDIELHYPDGGADDKVTPIRSYLGTPPLVRNFVELARTTEGREKQLAIVMELYPVELQEELRKIKNKITIAEKDRTETGRQKDAAEGYVKKSGIQPSDLDIYVKKIDVMEVSKDRQTAVDHNTKVQGAIERRNERLTQLTDMEKVITQLESNEIQFSLSHPSVPVDLKSMNSIVKTSLDASWISKASTFETTIRKLVIKDLMDQAKDLSDKNVEANKWIQENPLIDLASFDKQFGDASAHNSMVDRVAEFKKLEKEAAEWTSQYGELDALVQSSREAYRVAVRSFESPMPSLSFDESTVMYNGKPADESNTSTAERMMIDAMLNIHTMGRPHIIFLERGESLGKEKFNELVGLCSDNGIQAFIEQVERQEKKELRVVVQCGTEEKGA